MIVVWLQETNTILTCELVTSVTDSQLCSLSASMKMVFFMPNNEISVIITCKVCHQVNYNDMSEELFNFGGLTLLSMSHTVSSIASNPYTDSAKLAIVV
jgi:hypothetical protein